VVSLGSGPPKKTARSENQDLHGAMGADRAISSRGQRLPEIDALIVVKGTERDRSPAEKPTFVIMGKQAFDATPTR